jgi:glyoxalase-like protein
MRVDHVIYGTSELDAASARFEAAGLRVEPGGAHEGVGTHNRIVPLGADYVELLAILDPEMAGASPLGRLIAGRIARGDGWMGWGVGVEDAAAAADRTGASVVEVTRQGTGRLAGLTEALTEGYLPFFIQHTARAGPGGIDRIEVSGDVRRLEAWLGGAHLPVDAADGPPGVRAVTIRGRRL